MSVIAIIPAAGMGTRMGHETPKQFLSLNGVPIFILTLRKFDQAAGVSEIVVGVRNEEASHVERALSAERFSKPVGIYEGGATRQETVARALARIPSSTEVVLVHDAVRPFVTGEMINRAAETARRGGAAIYAIPSVDTIKQLELETITATLPRERIALAQTPQAFQYALLREAFDRAAQDGFQGTDESSLVERLGVKVKVLMGTDRNIKITKPSDLPLARLFLALETQQAAGAGGPLV